MRNTCMFPPVPAKLPMRVSKCPLTAVIGLTTAASPEQQACFNGNDDTTEDEVDGLHKRTEPTPIIVQMHTNVHQLALLHEQKRLLARTSSFDTGLLHRVCSHMPAPLAPVHLSTVGAICPLLSIF